MINKKLLTSVFDVKFELSFPNEPDWVFYFDNGITPATPPESEHLYLNDKPKDPFIIQSYPTRLYAGPAGGPYGVYTFKWTIDGENEVDWNSDLVEKDFTIRTFAFEEQTWTITFEVPEPPKYITINSTHKLYKDTTFTYETLPNTIYGIKNEATVAQTSDVISYGTNYIKNAFKYDNLNDVQHSVEKTGWAYYDSNNNEIPFIFGTTHVVSNLTLHATWKFKTWDFKIDYNTGNGRYFSDITYSPNYPNYTINGIYTGNGNDNFSPNNAPSGSTITNYANTSITGTFYSSVLDTIANAVRVIGWYNEWQITSGFDFDTKIRNTKTIYARWVNRNWVSKTFYASGPSYSNWSRITDYWGNVSSTYTVPSFCNYLYCYCIGAGGTSQQLSGCEATSGEYAEVQMSTPGGNAEGSGRYYGDINSGGGLVNWYDASKKSFSWYALGSDNASPDASWIRWPNSTSYLVYSGRGASGGAYSDAGRWRYNLGDDGREENLTDGSRSVLAWFAHNGSKGKTMYTKIAQNYAQLTNIGTTSQFRFRGYCRSDIWTNNKKQIDVYFGYWFYSNGGTTAYRADDIYLGSYVYEEVGSDNSNNAIFGWRFYNVGAYESRYRSYMYDRGKGGQVLFITNVNGPSSEISVCRGNGGYVQFQFSGVN